MSGGGLERKGDRVSNMDSVLTSESDVGLEVTNGEIMT